MACYSNNSRNGFPFTRHLNRQDKLRKEFRRVCYQGLAFECLSKVAVLCGMRQIAETITNG